MSVNSSGGFPPISPVSASKASKDVFAQQPESGHQVVGKDDRRQRRDRRRQDRRKRADPVLLDRRGRSDRRRKGRRRGEPGAQPVTEKELDRSPSTGLDLYV